jgi:hypothetical protein
MPMAKRPASHAGLAIAGLLALVAVIHIGINWLFHLML